jgi:hypothetical protein
MDHTLYNYFLEAENIGGVRARTRLSVLTKITSMQSKTLKPEPDLQSLFERSLRQVKSEMGVDQSLAGTAKVGVETNAEKLSKQIEIFTDVVAQRELYKGDIELTFKRVTEALTEAIDVERASVWLYTPDHSGIECKDLFERAISSHSSGTLLPKDIFPNYFKAIETQRTLAAHDAHTDPGTSEFSES